MTISEVRERVAKIESLAQRDAEAAHAERDDLMVDALRYIEQGLIDDCGDDNTPPAFRVAGEALKALNIKLRFEACA